MYTIYVVTCATPKHLYVGQTQNYEQRIASHKTGKSTSFIRRHGFRRIRMAAQANTRDEAIRLETGLYRRYTTAGYVVGGVNHRIQ